VTDRGMAPDTRHELSKHRDAIVRLTTLSASIPQFPVALDVDLTAIDRVRARDPERPSYTDIVSTAAARLLRRHPMLNASFDGDAIVEHAEINLGLALDTPRGLTVVVVRAADRLSLRAFRDERVRLTVAAGEGRLRAVELTGATFAISNLGPLGIHSFQAMLVPPMAAVLAIGGVRERPFAKDGVVSATRGVSLCLTCDHRVIDGAAAARFLRALGDELESGEIPSPAIDPVEIE
jgi:pyruvate/2-oxoglutarate dehydrogenase complex dihydrolipoamide acyltransferase (E2) component